MGRFNQIIISELTTRQISQSVLHFPSNTIKYIPEIQYDFLLTP